MSALDITLISITFLSSAIIVVIAPYIKKITNNYFFWLILGISLLIYLITCRFYDSWRLYAINGNNYDISTSRNFILDVCPFCALAICIAIVIDPTRKIATLVAPFALYGGLITICGIFDISRNDLPLWKFIFLGDKVNPLYFMMHYINVVVGTLVLLSVSKFQLSTWIKCNIFIGCYYFYVTMCMIFLFKGHDPFNVSGLCLYDWYGGEYSVVVDAFKFSSANSAAAFGFIMSYIAITLLMIGQNRLQLMKRYKWSNQWNKQKWYIGWYMPYEPKKDIWNNLQLRKIKEFWPLYLTKWSSPLAIVGGCLVCVGSGIYANPIGDYNKGSAFTYNDGWWLIGLGLFILICSLTNIIIGFWFCKKKQLFDVRKWFGEWITRYKIFR